MHQQLGNQIGVGVVLLDKRERGARRLTVELARVLQRLGLRAEGGKHRHLPRERDAQRVESLDAKPGGVLFEPPALSAVALERGARLLPGERQVRLGRTHPCSRGCERFQHACPHLGGGLDGEGDRGDLLRLRHAREQNEVPLDQELGFPRARGRLHDEGALRIERFP